MGMIYNLDGDFQTQNPDEVKEELASFIAKTKMWNNTQAFIRKAIDHTWLANREGTFEEVLTTVRDVGEHYSNIYDNECKDMKAELVKIESQKPGRVRLTDFYKVGLVSDVWGFTE